MYLYIHLLTAARNWSLHLLCFPFLCSYSFVYLPYRWTEICEQYIYYSSPSKNLLEIHKAKEKESDKDKHSDSYRSGITSSLYETNRLFPPIKQSKVRK